MPRWLPDLIAGLFLGVAFLTLLIYTASQPPNGQTFSAEAAPEDVTLVGFHQAEQNAAGGYRWTKPEAGLIVPVAAPGDYSVTLTLQDTPAAQPRRPVAIYVNGVLKERVMLADAPREYRVQHRLDPAAWSAGRRHALVVELAVAPFAAPGDPRQLGVVVTRVVVTPIAPLSPWQPAAQGPLLLLLVIAYGALRFLGLPVRWAAAGLGAALAAYALLAVGARREALALVYDAASQPIGLLVTALWLAASPLVARRRLASATGEHPAVETEGPRVSGHQTRVGRLGFDRIGRFAIPAGLREALALFVALRIGLSLYALLVVALFSVRGPCDGVRYEVSPYLHATGLDFRLLGVWQHWDACWYEQIAADGYRPGDPSVNFFPLYPLLIAAAGFLLAGNITLGGLIVSGLAYIAAMAGLYQLIRDDFGAGVARRTLLYISVFPAAFFFFVPYTEALFLALGVWSLALARQGAWGWAAVTAFLVGLTRTQGVLLAVPLAWECYRQWRSGALAAGGTGRRLLAALVPALPGGAFLAFMVYGKLAVGQTTLQTQSAQWGNVAQAPWVVIAASLEHIRRTGDKMEVLNLTVVLLFAVILTVGLRRLPLLYTLYALPQFLLIVVHQNPVSPLLASLRFALVIFPVFVLIAAAGRWRIVHYPWLIASLVLLALLIYRYMSGPLIA